MNITYTPTIGLEIHAQLTTNSKMFSPEAVVYGAMPNTHVSEITLAHPGVLPSINGAAIRKAIMMGLACKSRIAQTVSFYRKNYFYPDLPKGYQITQGDDPICHGGAIEIKLQNGKAKSIELERIHLEEDTGKSIHSTTTEETFLDFNRAGTPLIEIVTKPCMTTSEQAYNFLTELRKIVRYLEVCDGNMEEGSLRCDVNISIAPEHSKTYGQRVEIKNLNSIRNVQLAIECEIARQTALLESKSTVAPETRSYDPERGTTICLRMKNSASDYRYFPEPNLLPVLLDEGYIAEIKQTMPLLPKEFFEKFTTRYGLTDYDAAVLTSAKEFALYFEQVCGFTQNFKAAANWVLGPVKGYLNDLNIDLANFPIEASTIASLIDLVENDTLSFSTASHDIFKELLKNPKAAPIDLARSLGLVQTSDETKLKDIIEEVFAEYPDKVQEYRSGKNGVIDMFIGQVMRRGGRSISPKILRDFMERELNNV